MESIVAAVMMVIYLYLKFGLHRLCHGYDTLSIILRAPCAEAYLGIIILRATMSGSNILW